MAAHVRSSRSGFLSQCRECGRSFDIDEPVWRCSCGGLLELEPPAAFSRDSIETSEPGFWRYSAGLPPLERHQRLRLGEAMTPLVETELYGAPVHLKLDYLLPTGSYKDRGAAVLVSVLRKNGIKRAIDDSSGNAGAAAAAYAAAAGIDFTVLTPATNSPAKLAQISAYGANLVAIEGSRADVAEATMARANTAFYASHVWHPLYPAGVATLGFEIWEQLGYRAPAAVVVPAGQGSLVLGLARAFEALSKGGAIQTPPAIVAVQTQAFPALVNAFEGGETHAAAAGGELDTMAEGIACRMPLRGVAILAALRATRGQAVAVSEADIKDALLTLARSGFYVEPTSAVAAAGFRRANLSSDTDPIVVVLTGSGLKAGDRIAELIGASGSRNT